MSSRTLVSTSRDTSMDRPATHRPPGLDDTFSWFVPTKHGDHDLKGGFQDPGRAERSRRAGQHERPVHLRDRLRLQRRGSLDVSGTADHPRTSGRWPVHAHPLDRVFAQDKWRVTNDLTLNLGLRWDADIAPWVQPFNPLIDDQRPTRTISSRVSRFAYNLDGKSVIHGGIGRYYEKFFIGQFSPLQSSGVYGSSLIVNFPVASADPGPSNGRPPTDPMLVNGPVVNRALLNQVYPPGTLTRNTATVQDHTPDRQLPQSTQVSFGYSRQFATTMFWAADYIHNDGKGWLAYDLNPGLRANTTRTVHYPHRPSRPCRRSSASRRSPTRCLPGSPMMAAPITTG